MTHGSLFSGIGGFDLAAEWMGWENVFHCEYDPFCQKVLKHHFPNSKLYENIKTFNASGYFGRVDILSGGFPCQPFSNAGLRKGTDDDRHLWPQMLRVIREVSPRYVVGENVRGLLNWSGGLVFEQVCADLENEGYEVTPYLLPAAGKNAPHRRDRIWFIAQNTDKNGRSNNKRKEEPNVRGFGNIGTRDNVGVPTKDAEVRDAPDTDSGGLEGTTQKRRDGFNVEWEGEFRDAPDTESNGNKRNLGATQGESEETKRQKSRSEFKRNNKRDAPDTLCEGHKRSKLNGTFDKGNGSRESPKSITELCKVTNWENFPTQPPICGGDDGLPKELDGITFPKWRKESIKAYGNAIVPAVAHEIFKAIQKMEDTFVP